MSLDATRWAWQQKVTATQKLVLLSLADRADENHHCYPSTARLVNDTGLYRETIFKAIDDLEKLNLLSVKRELGKGNKFTLLGVNERHETSSDLPTGKHEKTSSNKPTGSEMPTSRKKPTPTSSDLPTTQSVNADTYQSVNADTESTIESTNNLSIESTSKNAQKKIDFFVGVNPQVVSDYLAVRKAKKAPSVSQTVFDGLVREAHKAGYTLEQALITCCERNWVGFNSAWVQEKNLTRNQSIAEQNKITTELARKKLFGNQSQEKDITHEARTL